ncbi:hypothetical protein PR202_ga30224 [Eleusine coracana subsp. coracana]|uniref:Chromo domain-containing protein n=1 Tax=Eleusine coracana subsp. coracana TaxID=191504 RepID=A0AAV5DLR4_ELECO|nr:hypothetical protein PR202_ga30224 [Eleusine coracana subsp. coracana]
MLTISLQLPSHSSVRTVFHVSQLKKMVGSSHRLQPDLPSSLVDFQVPEKILNHRVVMKGVQSVLQVLVKWSSWPSSMTTWEDLLNLLPLQAFLVSTIPLTDPLHLLAANKDLTGNCYPSLGRHSVKLTREGFPSSSAFWMMWPPSGSNMSFSQCRGCLQE